MNAWAVSPDKERRRVLTEKLENLHICSAISLAPEELEAQLAQGGPYPDLILWDAEQDGAENIARIRKSMQGMQTGILAFAAWESRDMLRKTLRAGASDTFFWPPEDYELEKAVRNGTRQALADRETRRVLEEIQKEQEELLEVKTEKILFTMISTENDLKELHWRFCMLNQGRSRIRRCRIGIIPAAHLKLDTGQGGDGISSASLTKRIKQLMKDSGQGVAITGIRSSGELSLWFWGDEGEAEKMCHTLVETIEKEMGLALHIGLGDNLPFPMQVRDSARQARYNAKAYNVLEQGSQVHLEGTARWQLLPVNLLQQEERMYAAVLSRNSQCIKTRAQDFCQLILKSDYLSIRQLERIRLFYHAMRTNWVEKCRRKYAKADYFSSPVYRFDLPFDKAGNFSAEKMFQDLTADMEEVKGFICELEDQERREERFVGQIADYISLYYTKDISQKELADMFFISPGHLCRVFRKQYHMGMVEYVNRLRVEKAKDLLGDASLSLADVSELVGFHDSKYFSRVFKNFCHCSPGQYKKQMLSI
ncbi:helix-turn-helix domain-containing protein [Hominifimenecus sp. rT4P-3]|uniref:helix-turn-helix domain-containing protein n=1 Tax=Hominifimenecus sp. rT4P-3 TaxID=3242979 RepID=UPI003DA4EAD2